MEYSIVIATLDRPKELAAALATVSQQTKLPKLVVIVDASTEGSASAVVQNWNSGIPVDYIRADRASAAMQRNRGVERVETELVAFMDDDVTLEPDVFARLSAVFHGSNSADIGGVAGRMAGSSSSEPGKLLRCYYRLQAGYEDETYGARLFGAAINCFPCYEKQLQELIPSEWLPSTCVMYRTGLVRAAKFPGFEGYSHMEDVYLSATVAKTHRIYFCRDAVFVHWDVLNIFKKDRFGLARGRFRNQKRVAREVMGLGGFTLFWKLLLHRIFVSFFLIRQRRRGWLKELAGSWL